MGYTHIMKHCPPIKRMSYWYMLQYVWTLKHYAKWENPDTKKPHILRLHLYETPRIAKSRDRKPISGCQRPGRGVRRGVRGSKKE